MNPLHLGMDRATVNALGWALVHFVWQGGLVAVALAALNLVLARASAPSRYFAGCAALVVMLALPVATFVVVRAQEPAFVSVAGPELALPSSDARAVTLPTDRGGAVQVRRSAPVSAVAPTPAARPAFRLPVPAREMSRFLFWIVLAWGAGVLLLTVRLAGGWWLVRRLGRRGASEPLEAWQQRLGELARSIGLSRPVRLCRSALVHVPTVIGSLKPVILLPASTLTGLTPAQIEAVLAHELAHIRRHDYLVNLLQSVVETLLFYHPAVWWVSRRVREERELCCDDLAVRVCGDPVGYARALCELESLREPALELAMAASGGSLLARVSRLLGATGPGRGGAPRGLLGALGAALMIALLALSSLDVRANDGRTPRLLDRLMHESAIRLRESAERMRRSATPMNESAVEMKESAVRMQEQALEMRETLIETRESTESAADGVVREGACKGDIVQNDSGDCPNSAAGAEAAADAGARATAAADPTTQCDETAKAASATKASKCASSASSAAVLASSAAELADAAGAASAGSAAQAAEDAAAAQRWAQLSKADRKKLERAGVGPEDLVALHAAGLGSVTVDQLVGLANAGVDADYVRELSEAGLDHLTVSSLIELQNHGVSGDYVKGLKGVNLQALGVRDLIRLADAGVPADWFSAMTWLGYSDLTIARAIDLANNGVTPDLASQMRLLFHRRLAPEELLRLTQQGVAPDYVAGMNGALGRTLTVDELVRLAQSGVSADHAAQARAAGHGTPSVEDLIRAQK